MRYDSRKTLNENRNLLREKCIPKDTKLNDAVVGNLISDEYPELGKWGDGTCKCSEEECLRFDKSCCKKAKVDVGPLKYVGKVEDPPEGSVEIVGINYNGDAMTLPEGTTNVEKFDFWDKQWISLRNDYNAVAKRWQSMATTCLKVQPERYNMCLTESANKLLDTLKQGAFTSFTYDGVNYSLCFVLNETDLSIGFSGYFGKTGLEEPGDCGSISWTQKSEEIKKSKTDSQVGIDKSIDSPTFGSVQTDKVKDTMVDSPIVGSEDSKKAKTDGETIRLVMKGDGGN